MFYTIVDEDEMYDEKLEKQNPGDYLPDELNIPVDYEVDYEDIIC